MSDPVPDISVVIPAFNEAARLPRSLELLSAYLKEHFPVHEVLIVDDGSTDSTAESVGVFVEPYVKLIRLEANSGKGAAIQRGMLDARGKVVMFMDADLSTPLSEIPHAMRAIAGGADVVIGSRSSEGSRVIMPQTWLRRSLGKIFNRCMRLITGLPYKDTQCGFKAFTFRAAEIIFPKMREPGFVADVEMLLIARSEGMRIVEIPVEWVNSPDSRVQIWRHPPTMLLGLLRCALRHRV